MSVLGLKYQSNYEISRLVHVLASNETIELSSLKILIFYYYY
jgi:hypothetical protein